MSTTTVTVRCVGCLRTRDISAGEVPAGEVPMCDQCLLPMLAVSAKAVAPDEERRDG